MKLKNFKYPSDKISEAEHIQNLIQSWGVNEIQKLLDAGFTFYSNLEENNLFFYCIVKLQYYEYDWYLKIEPYYGGFCLNIYECNKIVNFENDIDINDLNLKKIKYKNFDGEFEKNECNTYRIICLIHQQIKEKDNLKSFQEYKKEQKDIENITQKERRNKKKKILGII